MLRRRESLRWFTLVLVIACPLSLWGADREMQKPKTPIARLEVQPARVDWLPQIDYGSLVLTVAGPGEVYIQREFGAGETPVFSFLDISAGYLPDGVYAYELRAVPRVDPAAVHGPAAKEVQKEGGRPEESLVQSGHLWVQGGVFMAKVPIRNSPAGQSRPELGTPPGTSTTKDIVHPDDLVVQGHACIGPICTAVVPGDPALKLKEDFGGFLQIEFENIACCHPSTIDWALQANDPLNANGDFMIRDLEHNTTPFRIAPTAPDNSLTIFPFNGNIGLGTLTPSAKLHVSGSAGTTKALVQETSGTTAAREILEVRNNGGPVFILEDTSVPQRWAQGTGGANFVIDEQAHAGTEYTFTNTGNLTIAGTLTQGSSRDFKANLAFLDPQNVLARVSALPVSLWSYKDETAVRHVGPMAEDFHQAFGLGEDDKHIAPGDQAGVALLAVQGLNQVLQSKAEEIATLQRENADLTKRIEALEALLSAVIDKQGASAQAEPAP